ncbi:hypothetical protein B566_EDAN007514, partial [Ephemera danica]
MMSEINYFSFGLHGSSQHKQEQNIPLRAEHSLQRSCDLREQPILTPLSIRIQNEEQSNAEHQRKNVIGCNSRAGEFSTHETSLQVKPCVVLLKRSVLVEAALKKVQQNTLRGRLVQLSTDKAPRRRRSKHSHPNSNFTCHQCGRGFWGRTPYVQHLRSCSPAPPGACPLCSKILSSPQKLRDHLRFVHGKSEEQVYLPCSLCGKKCRSHGTLWEPNHNAKICSAHFEERFIERNDSSGRPLTMLNSDAVPTIFPVIKEKKSPPRGRASGPSRANASEQVSTELETIISVLKQNGLDGQVMVTGTEYLVPEHAVFIQQQAEYVISESVDDANTEVHDMLAQAIEGANIEFVENPEEILHTNPDLLDLDALQQEENQQITEAPPQMSEHITKMATLQLEGEQTPQTSDRGKKMATLPTEDGGNKIIYVARQGQQVATKIVPDENYQAGCVADFQASSVPAPQVATSSRTTRTQPFKPGDEK